MKRHITGSVLALALFISFFLSGNAFANTYAYVLEKDSDRILINNVESTTIEHTIDLDDTNGTTEGIITAMTTSPDERYLYFVTDNGLDENGKLYRADLSDDDDENVNERYKVKLLDSVGIRPKAVVAGLYGVYIYVANYGSNTVSVYSRATTRTISEDGFNKPVALAVTKGSSRGCDVFVANMGNNSVTMFNTYNKVNIPLDNRPTDILVTPDFEYVYVCNSDPDSTDGRITVIKPVDYYDVESDGDDIYDEGENEIVENIEIPGALPTKMGMVQSEDYLSDYIYAIDPVWTEIDTDTDTFVDDVEVTAGAKIMSVIDCSDRENEINTFSGILPESSNDLIGIASTRYGTSVYTVNGGATVDKVDISDNSTADSGMFSDQTTELFQDIILAGDQPLRVTGLTAESDTKGLVLLEWKDNNYGTTDFLIYRKDHDDDEKEYKFYLLDIVIGSGADDIDIESYEDRSVTNGKRYSYIVVPFTDVSRAIDSSEVTIKAKDTADTEICFISSVKKSSNYFFTGLLIIVITAFSTLIFSRRKI